MPSCAFLYVERLFLHVDRRQVLPDSSPVPAGGTVFLYIEHIYAHV
jgi:hypothetical protein